MLEKLLSLLSQDGIYRQADLARKLGVSIELMEQMMADLVRAGYFQPVGGCSMDQCLGCSQARSCKIPGTRLWASVK